MNVLPDTSRSLWRVALLVAWLSAAPATADNFLIVIADDVGVDKVGAYRDGECVMGECPSPPPTPTIDALAERGVLFRNAWATPVCSSTRVATLTGLHGFRTGVGRFILNDKNGLGLDESLPNIANTLRDTGYQTAAFGKWHMVGCEEVDGVCTGVAKPMATHPLLAGFDYFSGTQGNFGPNQDYCDWNKWVIERTGPGPNDYTSSETSEDDYLTWVTARDAADYVNTMTEPWLAYVAFNAAHTPLHVPPVDPVDCTSTFNGNQVQEYDWAVERMDTEIGTMLATIEAHSDVLDRTTVLFFGDNGTIKSAIVPPFDDEHSKGSVFEGGANVPFIVAGPQVLPAAEGGETAGLVHVVDIFDTVMEIAGLDPCAGDTCAHDSVSFAPYLSNPALASIRTWVYNENFAPNTLAYPDADRWAIRNDRYKIITRNFPGDFTRTEFYDLLLDPFEQTDLIDSLTTQEEAEFDALAAAMNALRGSCVSRDDLDFDCVSDVTDNCLWRANGPNEDQILCGGNQIDSDADGAGDTCDAAWTQITTTAEFDFQCMMTWPVESVDFDGMADGTLLSNAILPLPPIGREVHMPPPVDDVLNPGGPDLDLIAVADLGANPTSSGPNSLGPDDPADDDRFAAGTSIEFSFDQPMVAFALRVVTDAEPGTSIVDGDLRLSVDEPHAVDLDISEGHVVANVGGVDYYEYFLGLGTLGEFSSITLEAGPTTTDGAFYFNVDDLRIVPEPGARWLLAAGCAALVGLARRRR